MIIGDINQSSLIAMLGQVPVLQRSFEWIQRLPVDSPDGITELDGSNLYVNVHGYNTKPTNACRWESHRHTADLQFCLTGGELINWTPVQPAMDSESYDPVKDFEVWPATLASAETIHLEPGRFAIFLPGEVHRPMGSDGHNTSIRKLAVKIHARFLPLE